MGTPNLHRRARPVLTFKGQQYRLDLLKSLLKHAKPIDVWPEEINPAGAPDSPFHVRFSRHAADGTQTEIVFFRQEGKYTVLLGQAEVARLIARGARPIVGSIISGPMLKRAQFTPPDSGSGNVPPVSAPAPALITSAAPAAAPVAPVPRPQSSQHPRQSRQQPRSAQSRESRSPPPRRSADSRAHSAARDQKGTMNQVRTD
ncbi:hypothetical protein [Paraburkholderia adhaesiva]|uniref:hypothetical protein n=1 Tax=Paraburkholderia adhaesiva TaxID=2883244 RepID=UPI001F17C4A0|nr:hypothetical protein [Paraburkholderia adhaesiva]